MSITGKVFIPKDYDIKQFVLMIFCLSLKYLSVIRKLEVKTTLLSFLWEGVYLYLVIPSYFKHAKCSVLLINVILDKTKTIPNYRLFLMENKRRMWYK